MNVVIVVKAGWINQLSPAQAVRMSTRISCNSSGNWTSLRKQLNRWGGVFRWLHSQILKCHKYREKKPKLHLILESIKQSFYSDDYWKLAQNPTQTITSLNILGKLDATHPCMLLRRPFVSFLTLIRILPVWRICPSAWNTGTDIRSSL